MPGYPVRGKNYYTNAGQYRAILSVYLAESAREKAGLKRIVQETHPYFSERIMEKRFPTGVLRTD